MGAQQLPSAPTQLKSAPAIELIAMVCLWIVAAVSGAAIGDTLGRVIVWEYFPRNDWDGDLYLAMRSWNWPADEVITGAMYLPGIAIITLCLWYSRALSVRWWLRAVAFFAVAVVDAACEVIWLLGYRHEGWLAFAEVTLVIAAIFVLAARLTTAVRGSRNR